MKEQLLKTYKDGLGIKDENTASDNQKLIGFPFPFDQVFEYPLLKHVAPSLNKRA